MTNHLYASVNGCSSILAVNVSDSYSAPTASATVTCLSSSLDVGDHINIDLGYSGNHGQVFSGYVKAVTRQESPNQYEITAANAMVRAVDYFIASKNPSEPLSYYNISAEALIGKLMALAGVPYSGGHVGFTFATAGYPVEVNLTSVYDFSKMIADLVAWHIYADTGGTVRFVNMPPFPNGGGSVATLGNTNILNVGYLRSDRDLRNRVVVYGTEGVYAEASASSPYLPSGFHKTVVIAAPNVIDTNAMASATAGYNLAKLNRLTIGGSVSIIGDPGISCRDDVTVNKSDIGMSGQFFVYGCEHDWGREGYKTNLDLRQ